ncbi:cyanophycin synthetase [Mesobacillus foraminis]|uniref:Cyanophycin synthetase n=1 Tax=Mesobacillus foraminis TaxID=279826 RepID=A0A4R2BMG1_9BACI|nr:cyanophycin synthetase [Mesobacillus foraminis]TCN27752.1 cyanophycin synthetase [Mesobacillus foraminis]
MKINRVRYLKGPNYFNYNPTIWIELDIQEYEFQPSNKIAGFSESLISLMPGLKKHTCSTGYEGGFVERLYEGTWMGHILEHIAIELQNMAGIHVKHGKTVTGKQEGIYFVTYEYREPESGYYAFKAAMEIAEQIISGIKGIEISRHVNKISSFYYKNKLGPSTEAIYNAAIRRNIPVERIGTNSLLRLGTGSRQKFVQATITSQTSCMAVENSCDKQATKDILNSCGLPVPIGEVASSYEEIFKAAERLGFPLVIKPLNGRQGQGVITNIKNKDELFNVVHCLDRHVKEFIIEKYYEGHDYRLLVIGGNLVAASLRMPPFVIGNGQDTIRRLIEIENKNPLRGDGHEKPMTKIPFNYTVSCYLEKFDLSLNSIPHKGQIVQVVGNANLSTGGLAIDVTDEVHPTYKELAIAAAKAIGLDIAGIDLISKDIAKPLDSKQSAIIEVNAAPGIRMHHHPSKGKSRDAGKAIVNYLFKDREEAAIPVLAVTGTNGKTTTTRMIKHFLESEGRTVGMTNSDGVYIGSHCIDEGDCSGPISARKVLSNPQVDAAVLETARGGILREGLAFRYCDVGVVTNVAEDHLGIDGIETFDQLVKLKRLIPEVVIDGGACILNGDDPEVAKMASHTKGKVIFTSLDEQNPFIQKALKKGEDAWYVDLAGWIICSENGRCTKFLLVSEVPVTFDGTAKHNVSNLLQALAAVRSQGVDLENLKRKALSFVPDFHFSKGRFNRIEMEGRQIIIDYAHNCAGLNAVFEAVRSLKMGRVLTVLSAPGDRLDEDIAQLGTIAAKNTDVMVIKEDAELRGRVPWEVPGIIKTAAKKHLSPSNIHLVKPEAEAFIKAWEISEPGDLLLFLYEDFQAVKKFIELTGSKTRVDR